MNEKKVKVKKIKDIKEWTMPIDLRCTIKSETRVTCQHCGEFVDVDTSKPDYYKDIKCHNCKDITSYDLSIASLIKRIYNIEQILKNNKLLK